MESEEQKSKKTSIGELLSQIHELLDSVSQEGSENGPDFQNESELKDKIGSINESHDNINRDEETKEVNEEIDRLILRVNDLVKNFRK